MPKQLPCNPVGRRLLQTTWALKRRKESMEYIHDLLGCHRTVAFNDAGMCLYDHDPQPTAGDENYRLTVDCIREE